MAGTSGMVRRGAAKRGMPKHETAGPGEEVRTLAREAAIAAIDRLRALSNSDDERVALAATQELLNRAFGKVATGGDEQAGGAQPLVIKIVRFSGDDGAREAVATAAPKPGEVA